MYKKLPETEGARNEDQVYLIKEKLNTIKRNIECVFKGRKYMTEVLEKIVNFVERILYFNQLDQSGKGIKILTPNQMPSRLPIFLAQLNAGNNSEKLKNKIRHYCIICTDQKILTKQLYKSLIYSI